MRVSTAIVLVAVLSVAVAQVVVVPAAPQTSFDYAGLEPVPNQRPINMQPAKVVGVALHQGIPVVQNASALHRPVIVNADGSVWGDKHVVVVQNGRPAQVIAVPAAPASTAAPVQFTSPATTPSVPVRVVYAAAPQPVNVPEGPVTTPLGTVIAPDVRTHSPPAVDPTLFIPQPNVTHLGHVFHPATGAVSAVVHQHPVHLAPETEHRILQEVNRLVELIMHADATKQKKQARALRGNLRRVLRRLSAHGLMQRTVETASHMAKVSLAPKPAKKGSPSKKADKASKAVQNASKAVQNASNKLESKAPRPQVKRAINHADRAARRAERAVAKAERAINRKVNRRIKRIQRRINKKVTNSARIAINTAKDLAKADAKKATNAAAAAKAQTPVSAPLPSAGSASVDKALSQLRDETRRSLSELRNELRSKIGAPASSALVNIGKKVDVLSKSALAFEAHFKSVDNKLKSDAAAILGLNSRVDALSRTSARVEKALAAVNRDIATVTSKFNRLSRREQTLTTAAKAAIKSLAAKVETESKLVKKLVNTKSNFKRGVIASLAELDENIASLNTMADK